MKNTVLLLLISITILSCKKKESERKVFDIPYRTSYSSDFSIPKMTDSAVALPPEPIVFPIPETKNTLPEELEKNKLDINNIRSVTIESLNLNIKSPAGQTFDFMKSIKIYLGSSGKGEVLIASKDNINQLMPSPSNLELDVHGNNVVDYVKGPTYYFKIETVLTKSTTTEIKIGSDLKLLAILNFVQ